MNIPDATLTLIASVLGVDVESLFAWLLRNRVHHTAGILASSTTKNTKTANVPTIAIGKTREESLASCKGCKLLPKEAEIPCYSQHGTPAMGHHSQTRAYKRLTENGKSVEKYTAEHAIRNRHIKALMVRFGSIGDPARANRAELYSALLTCDIERLDPVGYTHFWREEFALDLRPWFLASCNTIAECEEAESMGWRTTLVVDCPDEYWDNGKYIGPARLAGGAVCFAMTKPAVTCNTCRVCTSRPANVKRRPILDRYPRIVFPNHGRGSAARRNRRRA